MVNMKHRKQSMNRKGLECVETKDNIIIGENGSFQLLN